MRILCIGQIEDRTNIDKQILKQTVHPDRVILLEDKEPAIGVNARRIRIAENHQKLIDIVKAYPEYDVIWQVEGDCIFKPDTLQLLIERYKQLLYPKLGYVSGVQVGRHGIYALGAWHFPSQEEFSSLDCNETRTTPVDATGFYCLLAPREAWLKGEATWNGERWGPDVNWGLSLKKQGYEIYADTNITVGHKTQRGEIWPEHISTCNVRFYKENGQWKYKTT